jgi:hypothetical protein
MALKRNIRPMYDGHPNIVTDRNKPHMELAFEGTRMFRRQLAKLEKMKGNKAKTAIYNNMVNGKTI